MTDSTSNDLVGEFDFSEIFDPHLQEAEQKFQGQILFKYCSEHRRDFFRKPTIRFTQKTSLNDRFELTKRWHEFGGAPVRDLLIPQFKRVLEKTLAKRFSDKNYMIARFEESQGVTLGSAQREIILKLLDSPEAQAAFSLQQSIAGSMTDMWFEFLSLNANTIIDEITSSLGIFSASENSTNDQLWALYASEGRGFSVGFNVQHPFFRTAKHELKDWPLFHKVNYTDDKIQDFWKNPYYLFAVKKRHWSFEEEWRMLKSAPECDLIEDYGGEKLFLCDVVPGMINSIIFGYGYKEDQLDVDARSILSFDPAISIKKAYIDTLNGCIAVINHGMKP
jgi:hypothetical protein